ncbi:MAG: hypothetical protein R3Y59_06900 [bacterium]
MKATIKTIEKKIVNTKNGEIEKADVTFAVDIKGSFFVDFLRKLCADNNITSAELLNREVAVSLDSTVYTNDEGKDFNYFFVKYINLLDDNGNVIFNKKITKTEENDSLF